VQDHHDPWLPHVHLQADPDSECFNQAKRKLFWKKGFINRS